MKILLRLSLVPLLLPLAAAVAAFSQTSVAIPFERIEGPVICILPNSGSQPVPLAPTTVRYNVVITDGIAQTRITQVFDNPVGDARDMVYVFPLPHDGAVHAMAMQVGDSLYRAEILRKEEAQQRYDSIVQGGGQAALLTQQQPNIFQQRIAKLGQGQRAIVDITVSQPLKYVDGVFEYAMPTRVAARYGSNVGDGWNPPEDRAGTSLQFNLILQTGFEAADVASPTHPLLAQPYDEAKPELLNRSVIVADEPADFPGAQALFLKSAETYPNRDFVLRFSRRESDQAFSVASYRRPGDDSGSFALTLYPDPELLDGARPDLEVVLLVDISGSQTGWPLQKEKELAQTLLSRLLPEDRLSVLSFNDGVQYAFSGGIPVAATPEKISTANSFIAGLSAGGGTNLLAGVQAALAQEASSDHKRLYVFLTDGFITDENAIFEALRNHPSAPTVFTFGAGANLNRFFLETSAEIGNGFATEILAAESAEAKMTEAWGRMESPQLKSISIDFGGAQVGQLEKPVSTNLFRGLPFTVYGRYSGEGDFTFRLTGDRDGEAVTLQQSVDFTGEGGLGAAVEKLWARKRIGRLDVEEGTSNANKEAIIALSLRHQVLTEYTAFLAARPEAVTEESDLGGGLTGLGDAAQRPVLQGLAFTLQGGQIAVIVDPALEILAVEVYDLSGRRLPTPSFLGRNRHAGRILLGRLESWKPGRYLLAVRTSRGILTRSFVVLPGGRLAGG